MEPCGLVITPTAGSMVLKEHVQPSLPMVGIVPTIHRQMESGGLVITSTSARNVVIPCLSIVSQIVNRVGIYQSQGILADGKKDDQPQAYDWKQENPQAKISSKGVVVQPFVDPKLS